MTEREREMTTEMLTAVLLGYPSSRANAETIAFYVMALDDLSFVEIRAALSKLTKTAKFFPTVAEIYEAAESVKQTAQGDGQKDAGQAWEEVMQLVRRCHVYKPWTFSTPEVEQAVREFGKQELCELEAEGVNTARAQFQRIYNAVVSRRKERAENKEILKRLGLHMTKTLNSNGRKQLAGGDHHEAMRCL